MPTNPSKVVVTDGFHITRPLELTYSPRHTYFFKIVCVIEDEQLVVGMIMIALLYAMGATSGMVLLQLLSLTPVFYFYSSIISTAKNSSWPRWWSPRQGWSRWQC